MSRRHFLQSTAALTAAAAVGPPPASAAPGKRTFRWALNAAETGFDPAQISDLYSNYVVSNIIESPLQYDFLARPAELRPRTAAAMPEVSGDFRTFTVRIRPGVHFQDDPAFKGQRRELTAHDHVYSTKRLYDPRWKSPLYSTLGNSKLLGLEDLRKEAQAAGKFDYSREVEGLRALDRYTFQIRLADPEPRFVHYLADCRFFGAVAHEVVEMYGDDMMAHPVGTGPFVLAQWKRSSFMALERSPSFREELYDARPPADDVRAQEIAAQLKGRRLPMVDRVELSVINESQPRWLSFLNGEQDCVNVPLEFINQAVPFGKVAPALAKQGIELDRIINPDIVVTLFNMDDLTIGGYTPEKVALRRAISLGYDIDEEIRLVRNDSMVPAQSPVPPGVIGFDPGFRSDMSRFDRAAARALLDTYGYAGPRRRRLARAPGWLAARAFNGVRVEPARPPLQRGVEAPHDRARSEDRVPREPVAGERQERARRQADDVAARLERELAGCGHVLRGGLRAQQGGAQLLALREPGVRPPVPIAAHDRGRAGARGSDVRTQAHLRRLHAVQGARPSLRQ